MLMQGAVSKEVRTCKARLLDPLKQNYNVTNCAANKYKALFHLLQCCRIGM